MSITNEREITKRQKGDIVQQIKDLYMKKGCIPDDEKNIEPLVPTKAALFALDHRFQNIDRQLAKNKLRRSTRFKTVDIDCLYDN